MSDQNIPKDWAKHFAALGPLTPYEIPPALPYEGWGTFKIVWVGKKGDLETVDLTGDENPMDRAKEVWEANEGPEMWLFGNPGGPPWHCPARPTVKRKGK